MTISGWSGTNIALDVETSNLSCSLDSCERTSTDIYLLQCVSAFISFGRMRKKSDDGPIIRRL